MKIIAGVEKRIGLPCSQLGLPTPGFRGTVAVTSRTWIDRFKLPKYIGEVVGMEGACDRWEEAAVQGKMGDD